MKMEGRTGRVLATVFTLVAAATIGWWVFGPIHVESRCVMDSHEIPGLLVWSKTILFYPLWMLLCVFAVARRWRRVAVVAMVFAVLLTCVWIGGCDGEPPRDDDLKVDDPPREIANGENAYYVLTNLAQTIDQMYARGDGAIEDIAFLWYYLDPVENFEEYEVWDGMGSMEAAYRTFMDEKLLAKAVETALASNGNILAIYDRAAAGTNYVRPTPGEYAEDRMKVSGGKLNGCVMSLLDLHRTLLPARIKLAAQKGEFEKSVSLFEKDVALAERICHHAGTLIDYFVGRALMEISLSNMSQLVAEYDFPKKNLMEIDGVMDRVGNLGRSSLVSALKREYGVIRICFSGRDALYNAIVQHEGSGIADVLDRLMFRYAFHPNRVLAAQATELRDVMTGRTDELCGIDSAWKVPWYETVRPNGLGWRAKYCDPQLPKVKIHVLRVLAVRIQIAQIRYVRKYGKEAKSMEELEKVFNDCPKVFEGQPVCVDLEARTVRCGGTSAEIPEARRRVFPFISRNGRIMTNDGKVVVEKEI